MVSYEHLKRLLRDADGNADGAAVTYTYTRRPQPLHQRIIAAGACMLCVCVLCTSRETNRV